MKHWLANVACALTMVAAHSAGAQVTLYGEENFRGRDLLVERPVGDLSRFGFSDQAASAQVRGGTWQFCTEANFYGRCVTLGPGDYPSLSRMGMTDRVFSLREMRAETSSAGAGAVSRGRVTLYENDQFSGRGITLENDIVNLDRVGFDNRARSAIVEGGAWQLCEQPDFQGSCVTMRTGRYADLGTLGGRVSSARAVAQASAPPAVPNNASGRAVLFGQPGLQGRSLVIDRPIMRNLADVNFNDRARSLRVEGGYWMFCSDAEFEGECRTFGPGDYPVLPPELMNSISSGRRITNQYPYGERPNWAR